MHQLFAAAQSKLVLATATSEADKFFQSAVGQKIQSICIRIALLLLVGAILMAIGRAAQGNRQGAMRGFFSLFALAALLALPTVLGPILDFLGGIIKDTADEANHTVTGSGGSGGGG